MNDAGLLLIQPEPCDLREETRLQKILKHSVIEVINRQACHLSSTCRIVRTAAELEDLLRQGKAKNRKILIAAALGREGINLTLFAMLHLIREYSDPGKMGKAATEADGTECWNAGPLSGSVGAVLIDADSEYYTKALSREIVRTCNAAGCTFPGRPMVEGTHSLKNFLVNAGLRQLTLPETYAWAADDLVHRLLSYDGRTCDTHEILCIHACDERTSNTYWLWKQMCQHFSENVHVREITLRERKVMDCAGCTYEMCMYYSKNDACYYGGTMVEEVYPALEQAQALILLCPNYNDALSANLTAFINRLTAPFRRKPFDDKYLFAVIVSGYSGGDLVASQLIDSLNMNKSFILPGNFALLETANARGSIKHIPGIQEQAAAFAGYIQYKLLA